MINKISPLKQMIFGTSLCLFSMSAQAVVLNNNSTSSSPQSLALSQPNPAFADQLIIKYKTTAYENQSYALTSDIEQSASSIAGVMMKHSRTLATGAHVMTLPTNNGKVASQTEVAALLIELQSDPNVEYAELDRLLKPMATPNDPQYSDQWHYYEPTGGLNTPAAWDTTTGQGAVVAVIDTGITSHPDLNANVLPGYDMIASTDIANDGNGRDSDPSDPGDAVSRGECGGGYPPSNQSSSWHGTHVAGTVAAVGNNNTGVVGVAYGSKVVPIRALGKCGGRTSDIADGIIWAAGGNVSGIPTNPNPAQVINLSLGGSGSCDSTSQSAINIANQLGALVVVAAGNSNRNASNATPANCQNVVTVAATNRSGGRANYSNYGNVVDVAAPGGQQSDGISQGVLSTLNSGNTSPGQPTYEFYQGTSMATPHVAGAAALLYAVDPTLTPSAVEGLLKTTARNFPSSCSGCGAGIVDAAAAVAAVNGDEPPVDNDNTLTNGTALTNLSGATGSDVMYTLDVPAGASNLTIEISGGSGDVDMYVRFGAEPTTNNYDCRPYRWGNEETCDITSVRTGTYYVMLRGYAAYSGVRLIATFDEDDPQDPGEADSISESNLSASRRQWVYREIEVPAGQSQLVVSIGGASSTGDADLYLRRGLNPTLSSYDCRPYRWGNEETCTINAPQAGTYYIGLYAYSAFTGLSLTAASE